MPCPSKPLPFRRLSAATIVFHAFCYQAVGRPDTFDFSRAFIQEELIGTDAFLAEHPEFDGRGVTIAVLDTGVDPAALGMQVTSDGERKVVDLLDCTGAGAVELAKVDKPGEPRIAGLTGRDLALPPELLEKATEIRRGMHHAVDFFPGGTFQRVMEDRKRRLDDEARARAVAERGEEDESVPSPRPADETRPDPVDDAERKARDAARKESREKAVDAGPVYDCVAMKTDEGWFALVDIDEDGDLAEEKPLRPFGVAGEFVVLPRPADLTLAVQIAPDGASMTLVTVGGSHGTHCAAIAAACVPDRPEMNGVAPGARILSCQVGDPRLGGMETPLALSRAFDAAVAYGADVVSMSYGEAVLSANRGWLVAEARRLAEEKGIVFVAAAGNEGPGLSTVGAPGGTTNGLIGVGAYVTPEMRTALAGKARGTDEVLFGFSSRGPAFNGDVGVDILAPGAARASIPVDEEQGLQTMNGTSMATPHVSGAAACLLSGAKASNLAVTPAVVERALKATALSQRSDFEPTNPGLLQLPAAWGAIEAWSGQENLRRAWSLAKSGEPETVGIYLRDAAARAPIHRATFTARPLGKVGDEFATSVRLVPSANWIAAPPAGVATKEGLRFDVELDLAELPTGVHAESVDLFDASSDSPMPLASLPVTVIVPHARLGRGESFNSMTTLAQAIPSRTFFTHDARSPGVWVELTAADAAEGSRIFAEILQRPTKYREIARVERWTVALDEPEARRRFVALRPGEAAELVVTAFSSSNQPIATSLRIEAAPATTIPPEVVLPTVDERTYVDVTAGDTETRIQAKAGLESWTGFWRPKSSSLDRVPALAFGEGKASRATLERLRLTYEFETTEKRRVEFFFAPEHRTIYDHVAGGWTYAVLDANDRVVHRGDYREANVELAPGKYRVEVAGYGTSKDDLEKAKQVALHWRVAYGGAKEIGVEPREVRTLRPGESLRLELDARDVDERSPLAGAVGVEGEFHWDLAIETDGDAVRWSRTSRLLRPYGGGDPPSAEEESQAKMVWLKEPERTERERVETLLRWLASVPADRREDFDREYGSLATKYPDEPAIAQARLHWLDQENERKSRLDQIVAAADAVVAEIDQAALREHLADRQLGAPAGNERRELFDWRRGAIVDALYRKGRALGYRELPEVVAERPLEGDEAERIDQAFRENQKLLARWIDPESERVYLLRLRELRRDDRFGAATELSMKRWNGDRAEFWPAWKRFELYDDLGWTAEREMMRSDLLRRFPKRAVEELAEPPDVIASPSDARSD